MRWFNVTHESRSELLERVIARQATSGPMYWVQLLLAMAIATLGLALGSSAVVIGAMLISPLMTPIVELGLGLAAGSPLVTLRALIRVGLSVVIVVVSAGLMTLLLPFHEITAPIAARVSPTALDLLVAICCALMAAFTTMAANSAATTTAAGTAVALALVPPLCVVGFGLGTSNSSIAMGAALLFTANLVGIVFFAAITFVAFGFAEVDASSLEEAHLYGAADLRLRSLARALHNAFASRFGAILRFIMPLALLAGVSIPLARALREVTWEVRARQDVQREIARLPLARDAVRSEVEIAHHDVHVRLFVVGGADAAHALERTLRARIATSVNVTPAVQVVAVADEDALRAATEVARPAPTPPPPPPEPDLSRAALLVGDRLTRDWPTDAAGALVAWRFDLSSAGTTVTEVVHVGRPLGAAAEALLARDVSDAVGSTITVHDLSFALEATVASSAEDEAWLAALTQAIDASVQFSALHVCIGAPREAIEHGANDAGAFAEIVASQAARVPDERAPVRAANAWSFRVQGAPCAQSEPAGDASVDAAATAAMDASVDARERD